MSAGVGRVASISFGAAVTLMCFGALFLAGSVVLAVLSFVSFRSHRLESVGEENGYKNLDSLKWAKASTLALAAIIVFFAALAMIGVSIGSYFSRSSLSSVPMRTTVVKRASGVTKVTGRVSLSTFHIDGESFRKASISFVNSDGVEEIVGLDTYRSAAFPQSGQVVDATVDLDGAGHGVLLDFQVANFEPESVGGRAATTAPVIKRVGLYFVTFSSDKACGTAQAPEACTPFTSSEADTIQALYGDASRSVVAFYKVVSRGKLILQANDAQTHRIVLKKAVRDEEQIVFDANAAVKPPPSSYDNSIFILPKNFGRGNFEGGGIAGLGDMDGKNSW